MSFVAINKKNAEKKLIRFQKIAKQAAAQSGRGIVPKINDILKSVLPTIMLANTVLTSYGIINYKKSIKIKIIFFINLALLSLSFLYYIYTIIAIIALFALCL